MALTRGPQNTTGQAARQTMGEPKPAGMGRGRKTRRTPSRRTNVDAAEGLETGNESGDPERGGGGGSAQRPKPSQASAKRTNVDAAESLETEEEIKKEAEADSEPDTQVEIEGGTRRKHEGVGGRGSAQATKRGAARGAAATAGAATPDAKGLVGQAGTKRSRSLAGEGGTPHEEGATQPPMGKRRSGRSVGDADMESSNPDDMDDKDKPRSPAPPTRSALCSLGGAWPIKK
eukprot:gene8816-33583_t